MVIAMVKSYYSDTFKVTIFRVYFHDADEINNWLLENVGLENWCEYIGFTTFAYRAFSFKDSVMETLFTLRFS